MIFLDIAVQGTSLSCGDASRCCAVVLTTAQFPRRYCAGALTLIRRCLHPSRLVSGRC
jgi:hypothetical protein